MAYGQLTGVRSLQDLRFLQAFIAAQTQNVFSSEIAGTVDGQLLFAITTSIDKVATMQQNASWRQEHTDAYCMARDFRYAHRSRKWLFAKALSSKFDQTYEAWRSFVLENYITQKHITQLPDQDIVELVKTKFDQILKV